MARNHRRRNRRRKLVKKSLTDPTIAAENLEHDFPYQGGAGCSCRFPLLQRSGLKYAVELGAHYVCIGCTRCGLHWGDTVMQ